MAESLSVEERTGPDGRLPDVTPFTDAFRETPATRRDEEPAIRRARVRVDADRERREDPASALVERYTRQVRLPEFGAAGQRALASARVAVIGAGGLGAPVLTYLAAAGVGHLAVHDPDTVDVTNLHRQVIHDSSAVGTPKAISAAQRLHALNPVVEIEPVVDALTTANVLDRLRGYDLVIDGTDNFPTRYLASDACEMLNVPLVWGSILGFTGQVSVFWADGGRGVTYRDVHPTPPRPGEVPNCAEAGVLGMLCGVIGSTMAMEAVKVLAGIGDVLHGRLALYDALRMRWDMIPLRRNPDRAPVTELEDLRITCGLPGPTGPALAEVTAHELPELQAAGRRVIDIREQQEVADGGLLDGAEHVPMGELLRERDPETLRALEGAVLYCAAGSRSAATQRALAERGVSVLSLAGGAAALVEAGLPLSRE